MKLSRINIKIGLVQGFYWMASLAFVSFLVRLLSYFGYSDYESGVALSVSAFSTLTAQPLIGKVADRAERVSFLIVVSLLLSSLLSLLLIPLCHNRVVTYILIFIIFALFRSLIYIIDIWSFSAGKSSPDFSYGFTRSFGSVFYALSAPVFGWAIDKAGALIIIPLFILFSILSAVCVALSKEEKKERKVEKERRKGALKTLLRNRYYVVLLVSYTLVEMSSVPAQNYLTRKMEVLNASEMYTGLALLLMGLLQILPLNAMDKLKAGAKAEWLIWVSIFGLFMRALILAFASTAIGVACAFLTEPFAFGLYIGAIMYYMHFYLPPSVIYYGTTLYSALTSGIGGIVGNYGFGLIADRIGINRAFSLMALPSLVGLSIFSAFLLFEGKKTHTKS